MKLCCILNPIRECPACRIKMCDVCYSRDTNHSKTGSLDRICKTTGKRLVWANNDLDDYTWVVLDD